MYFYQDHFIWSDGDRSTEFVLRVEVPQLGHASVATTSRYLHARPDDGSANYLPA